MPPCHFIFLSSRTDPVDSVIPHLFGRGRPIVIDNIEPLKHELELVDTLGDMEIATQLISLVPKDPATGKPVNPLDANFRSLALSRMDPVPRSSMELARLQAYTRGMHDATHQHIMESRSSMLSW